MIEKNSKFLKVQKPFMGREEILSYRPVSSTVILFWI